MPKKKTLTDSAPMVVCDNDILISDESNEIYQSLINSNSFKQSLKTIKEFVSTFNIHEYELTIHPGHRYLDGYELVKIRSYIMFNNEKISTELVSKCIVDLMTIEVSKLVEKCNIKYTKKNK